MVGKSIINVIISYYIEVLNTMLVSSTAPYIYVLCVAPLPLVAAQFAYLSVHCCGSLIVALGAAISCFQLVYVINFEALFCLDPDQVGRRTFVVLALVTWLPHVVEGVVSTVYNSHVAKDVTLLTQNDYQVKGCGRLSPFFQQFQLFWIE
jgi:hypothetical protein